MMMRIMILIAGLILSMGVAQALTTDTLTGTGDMTSRQYEKFGCFNGGGNLAYAVNDELKCSVPDIASHNVGDCFWPPAAEQLSNVGDYAQIDVKINYGEATSGEPAYRTGPGLFLSAGRGLGINDSQCIEYFIGNVDNDVSRFRRVVALQSLGSYSSGRLDNGVDGIWNYGDWVTLRVTYTSATAGGGADHQYTFAFDVNHSGSFTTMGAVVSVYKLINAGPYFKWSGYLNGFAATFPLNDWADADNFYPYDVLPTEVLNGINDPFDGTADLAARGYESFGFFNGGGGLSYSVNDQINVTQESNNNRGEVLWAQPLGTEQLANLGDSAQVDVRVNFGESVSGEALYRSGPGLYLSDSQTGAGAGDSSAVNAQFLIGNTTDEFLDSFQVLLYGHDGGYNTKSLTSATGLWSFGDWVTLKVTYTGDTAGYTYQFSYDLQDGNGFATLGFKTFTSKLAFAGPQAYTSFFGGGTLVNYPVENLMSFDNFRPGQEFVAPPAAVTKWLIYE